MVRLQTSESLKLTSHKTNPVIQLAQGKQGGKSDDRPNRLLSSLILVAFVALGITYVYLPNAAVSERVTGDAVIIVIKVVLALIALGASSYVVMPTMYNLKTDNSLWENVTGDALTVRDSIYDIFVYMPLIVGAMVILWGYMAAARKTVEEL